MLPLDRPTVARDAEAERRARISALGNEETRLTKSINELRVLEEDGRTVLLRRKEEIAATEKDHEAAKRRMAGEISTLEDRRRKALEPIDERTKAAETMFVAAVDASEKAGHRIVEARIAEKAADTAREALAEEQGETERLRTELDLEKTVWGAMKDSAKRTIDEALAQQARTQEETAAGQTKLDAARADIETERVTLKEYAARLDAERSEIAQERRAIKSGYEALAAARREILGRDT